MKQISVFLENKPGALQEMTKVLADGGINLRAISLSEAEGFGIVRFIAEDVYKATTVLKDEGFVHNLVPVVAAAIPDETGGLLKVLNIIGEADINIDYMYAFDAGEGGSAGMVFKVANEKAAESALRAKGIRLIEE